MIPVSSPANNRKPYEGPHTSLVIAMDVGTTFSGVSYAVLRPGEVPFIQGVTRFPDQGRVSIGDKKVPSVLYYDETGTVRAAGASTEDPNVMAEADDEGWKRVEHFKLHLRPTSMSLDTNGLTLGTLPAGKTAVQVFGDFLAYLFQNTLNFILETHVDGPSLWETVKDRVEFVLSHPNGWEGQQQQLMRQCAIHANLVPDTAGGRARVKFVTEGEASLHACLTSGLGPESLKAGDAFVIADAGGGTLDVNTYEITATKPLKIQELAAPDCRFAGSVFVNRHAEVMLRRKLRGSRYDDEESIAAIVQDFDRTTKRLFSNDNKVQWVTVGGFAERNAGLGVRNGKLKLEGKEVAQCFDFSVAQAVESILKQRQAASRQDLDVWLVGGFASSPWLYDQLKAELAPLGFKIYRPDANTSKVVADGAVGYYLDRWVTARVAKVTCGTTYSSAFNPLDLEHRNRSSTVFRMTSGNVVIPGQFHCFVSKGTKVSETTTFSSDFYREVTSPTSATFTSIVTSYMGDLPVPHWVDEKPGEQFKTLCKIDANLRPLCQLSNRRMSPSNTPYWHLDFEIEVKFGLAEYEARIKWIEDGQVKYGPASIIYED